MQFSPEPALSSNPEGDAQNSVFFSSTVYGDSFGRGVLAITLISSRTDFTETDVFFNNAIDFDSYRGPRQGGLVDFHRVALHEFGHVLGLDHPDDFNQRVLAIMNSFISNTDALTDDDIAGAHSIYDSGPPRLAIPPSPNLVNLSTRAISGAGQDVLIGGFIIQGSQPASVILRGIAPSLASAGVNDALVDPQIELRNATGTLLAQSDDWVDNADAITIAGYGLDPVSDRESAIFATLSPGNYTAIVKSVYIPGSGPTGTCLFELYDLHTGTSRAANISTRAPVFNGNNVMIAGFIVGGSAPKEVIIRGIGPSLATAGITDPLPNPKISLYDAAGRLLFSNDNWQTDPNAGRAQAAGLAPTQPVEAALDVSLNPGAYTAILSDAASNGGVGLVEVYDRSAAP